MWFFCTFSKIIVLVFAMKSGGCEAISNTNFNTQIRDFAVTEHFNLTDVKTLQKQGLGLGRYANFAPEQNVVFKEVPDNVISESKHGRGLLHHDNHGYGYDYEDPHYTYEYKPHDYDHHDHDYHHYEYHDDHHHHSPGHHHGYGHHHKHYDHDLATKTLLWPIAGIALLGAAAALVTNPVLLQLGVVSGRRRRHVDEIEETAKGSINKWSQRTKENVENANVPKEIPKRISRKEVKLAKRVQQLDDKSAQFDNLNTYSSNTDEERRFIPIPLKMNKT